MGQVQNLSCGTPSGGSWVELAKKDLCNLNIPLIWQEGKKPQENKVAPVQTWHLMLRNPKTDMHPQTLWYNTPHKTEIQTSVHITH